MDVIEELEVLIHHNRGRGIFTTAVHTHELAALLAVVKAAEKLREKRRRWGDSVWLDDAEKELSTALDRFAPIPPITGEK